MLLPVLAGTARLAFVAVGGVAALNLMPSLTSLFAVVACGLAVLGVLTALAVFKATWEQRQAKG